MNGKISLSLALASATMLHAENAVVLESCEGSISNASLVMNQDGRPTLSPPGVSLEQYSQNGVDDANVTDGSKSLKVVFGGKEKFSFDFQIKLPPEASAKVRKAAASQDV